MKPEPAAVEPAEDRLRVLVIDDERDHAETVAEILEAGGYACAVATSGKEGARRIQSEEFDLVLTSAAHTEEVVQQMSPASQQYCLVVLGSVAQALGGRHFQV